MTPLMKFAVIAVIIGLAAMIVNLAAPLGSPIQRRAGALATTSIMAFLAALAAIVLVDL